MRGDLDVRGRCGHALLRLFGPGGRYGDPFEQILFVEPRRGRTAFLMGLRTGDARLTTRQRLAIASTLRNAGYRRMQWDRYKSGRSMRTITAGL